MIAWIWESCAWLDIRKFKSHSLLMQHNTVTLKIRFSSPRMFQTSQNGQIALIEWIGLPVILQLNIAKYYTY